MDRPSFSSPPGLPPSLDVVGRLHHAGGRSVWRLAERSTGANRVLKLIHPDAPEAVRRGIAEEFLLLERIRHSHWVRPSGFIHLPDGSRGYFMEYLEGDHPCDSKSPGWGFRDLNGLRTVLGALSTLHALGFAHLDLKPSQVMCVPGRGSVLIDPGLSAAIGTIVAPRGTWGFIAPEVLTASVWDRRADLYAFACMLVLLWTGESLLGDGEIGEQVRRQMKRPRLRLRDRIEDLPEGMDYIIESLLDPDPERRPATAAETWRAFHTIAGYREFYLDHERLPMPTEIPFFPPADAERDWDRAIDGSGPDRWVIEGPVGSGRHRLLGWFRARAEVRGASTSVQNGHLEGVTREGRRLDCRVGIAEPGERAIPLGPIGTRAAAAALEAYGLAAEGGEQEWSRELLRLRLEERLGGEVDRRRCARERRTIAAGMACDLSPDEIERLAGLLAAVDDSETPAAAAGDAGLVSRGLVRIEDDGKLSPASPPWDSDSLKTIAGGNELARAHRKLLSERPSDPLVTCRHAVAARDPAVLRASIADAVGVLRGKGDAVGAHDLLVEAGEILGRDFVKESLEQRVLLVLESGIAPGLALLNRQREDLPPEWRALLDGHLAFRVRNYDEALLVARKQREESRDPILRLAATTMLIRSLHQSGRQEEALEIGLPFVRSGDARTMSERLPIAITMLAILARTQGHPDALNEMRASVEASLSFADPKMKELASSALGSEAFRRGDWARASRFLQMQIDAATQLREPGSIALAKMSLAGISFVEGRVAECEALNREALALAEEAKTMRVAANVLMNIGIVLDHTGRFSEALSACRRSRMLLESEGDHEVALHSLAHELTTLANAGLLRAARQLFEELLSAVAPLDWPLARAGAYFDMAQVARCEGKIDEARSLLRQALDIFHEYSAKDEIARTAFTLALLELALNHPDSSERLLEDAEAAYQLSSAAEVSPLRDFSWAAHWLTRQDSGRARDHLGKARETVQESGRLPWIWKCHAADAMLARRLGDLNSTLESLSAARLALFELLEAIHNQALKESYVLLPDPRAFLAWCDQEGAGGVVPQGSSDLQLFGA